MKKRVLSIALVIALVAIIAGGSLAYFTSRDVAQNTFAFPGDGTTDPVDVDLIETAEVPDDAEYTAAVTDTGITYGGVMPSMTLSKIPAVENTGASAEYIMVVVQLKQSWLDTFAAHGQTLGALTDIVGGLNTTNWTAFAPETNAAAGRYAFLYNGALAVNGVTESLFTSVTIPNWVDNDDLATISDGMAIDLTAYGVQTVGFADAATAFQNADVLTDLNT